jgi:phage tail sheath protein FI
MPEYLTPGVYVEEIERGPRPIEGVATSTAGFLGEAERGPIKPRLVTSYAEYQRWFGGVFDTGKFLPDAVSGFFENGGRRLFVCRLVGDQATSAQVVFGRFTVRAIGPGADRRQPHASARCRRQPGPGRVSHAPGPLVEHAGELSAVRSFR